MFSDIIFLLLGIGLLLAGGNYVTDGSVTIARRFRVSSLVIGLTVVSFGSSMPDLVVCVTSTLRHKSEMALGDVVGANIFDVLLVFGIMALVRPLQISREMRNQDLPMLFLSSAALFFCGDDILFDHAGANLINRTDGLMLLSLFVIFLCYTLSSARAEQRLQPCSAAMTATGAMAATGAHSTPPAPASARSAAAEKSTGASAASTAAGAGNAGSMIRRIVFAVMHPSEASFGWSWAIVAAGLGMLVLGGSWVVDGASGIALKAGLSEGMVGLTIVAVGSSLPDLASSLVALYKGEAALAIGNLVGACILNVFGILGICAVIAPLHAENITFIDFSTLAVGALAVWMISLLTRRHTIGRIAGLFLTLAYVGYIAYLVVNAAR